MSEPIRVRIFGLRVVAALLAWSTLVGSPALAFAGQARTEPGGRGGQEDPVGDAIDEMRFRDLEDELRRLREELADLEVRQEEQGVKLDGMTVAVGPCEERRQNTTYRAETGGIAIAVLHDADGSPMSFIEGFVAPEPGVLELVPQDHQYFRANASIHVAQYVPLNSGTMPVGKGEYWRMQRVSGTGLSVSAANVIVSWCPVVLQLAGE